MTRMTKNNVDIWHKMRFIAIPVLAIAAHFLLSNLLYYFVERLFLDIFHIPVQQFMKYSYLGELLISTVLSLYASYSINYFGEKRKMNDTRRQMLQDQVKLPRLSPFRFSLYAFVSSFPIIVNVC